MEANVKLGRMEGFFTNVEKTSLRKVFFSVLSKEKPNLGISFGKATNGIGEPLNNWVAIYLKDQMTVEIYLKNPMIDFLIDPADRKNRRFGKSLEKKVNCQEEQPIVLSLYIITQK